MSAISMRKRLLVPLVITSVTAVHPEPTNPSSNLTVILIVLAVLVVLFAIIVAFGWRRKQIRKHRAHRSYEFPSVTARTIVSQTSHETAYEQRMDSARYNRKSKSKKVPHFHPKKIEHPSKWRQQHLNQPQRSSQYELYDSQYQSQYDSQGMSQVSLPPSEVPMLEPHRAEGPSLSIMELEQSQTTSIPCVDGVELRQTDPGVIERTQAMVEKVMAELEEDPEFEECWIPYDSLYFTRAVSKGAFGEVWLAQLENTQVAVKKILDEKKHDVKEIECFGAEIKLMALLKHPQIVRFIGVSWSDKQDLCAVTEFMGKGDLYGYLERRKGKLNWPEDLTLLAEDIAEALKYLHSLNPKVIHRDLKSKNILLDNEYRAKLSDFGISRKRSLEQTMTAGVGTIYWTAPEVLMGKKYTEKADIYSFGIVMSEMDTCEVPYSDKRDNTGKKLQSMKIIQMVIRMGLRPTFQKDCPLQIKALADRCLSADPENRPDAPELLHILRGIQEELQYDC